MKKKLIAGVLIAALAVCTAFAFTACGKGVNGTPESAAKAVIEANYYEETDRWLDLMYFENSEDRETIKEIMDAGKEEAVVDIEVTEFECTVTYWTDEELEEIRTLYESIEIESAATCDVKCRVKGTITTIEDGNEITEEIDEKDEEGTKVVLFKIKGKWYVNIVGAGGDSIK